MADIDRFDVLYRDGAATIEPHFCREWDDEGGCYGTRPDHGFTFDEACDQIAEWHEQQATQWRERSHHSTAKYTASTTEEV